jgi:hypothetical protein
MLDFKNFLQLDEAILSPGIKPEHEKFREQYRGQIHDMIKKSYSHPSIGGYGGLKSGSEEESKAIHSDISSSLIKMTRRGEKITSVNLYKKQFGRKSIAAATDGTPQGKADFMKNKLEDHEMKRAWGEVSGAPEAISMKMGLPVISVEKMKKLTGKTLKPVGDTGHYERTIGGQPHVKIGVGHPKESE